MNTCLQCNKEITKKKNKFCSQRCAAIYNNHVRSKENCLEKICPSCLRMFECIASQSWRIYCSQQCAAEYKSKDRWQAIKEKIEKGDTYIADNFELNHKYFKRFLIEKCGEKCCRCGWNERNIYSNKIPIELEHIDGNCLNNDLNNLTLLCPNCHSLTSTYKSLNRSSSGSPRYKRYRDRIVKKISKCSVSRYSDAALL